MTSWWNPTSVLVGLLAVALGAFLAAAYLVVKANHRGEIAEEPAAPEAYTGPTGLVQ